MVNFYILKPFSPNLLIYKNQLFSSFYSIFHRISALILFIYLIVLINIYLFSLNVYLFNLLILSKLVYFIFSFFHFFILKISFFHILNGLKMIFYNFNYLENKFILNIINNLLILLLFIFLLY